MSALRVEIDTLGAVATVSRFCEGVLVEHNGNDEVVGIIFEHGLDDFDETPEARVARLTEELKEAKATLRRARRAEAKP